MHNMGYNFLYKFVIPAFELTTNFCVMPVEDTYPLLFLQHAAKLLACKYFLTHVHQSRVKRVTQSITD